MLPMLLSSTGGCAKPLASRMATPARMCLRAVLVMSREPNRAPSSVWARASSAARPWAAASSRALSPASIASEMSSSRKEARRRARCVSTSTLVTSASCVAAPSASSCGTWSAAARASSGSFIWALATATVARASALTAPPGRSCKASRARTKASAGAFDLDSHASVALLAASPLTGVMEPEVASLIVLSSRPRSRRRSWSPPSPVPLGRRPGVVAKLPVPLLQSSLSPLGPGAQLRHRPTFELGGIDLHAVAPERAQERGHVAPQQLHGLRLGAPHVQYLRHVYEHHALVMQQKVVGGEVAVHQAHAGQLHEDRDAEVQ